MLLLVCTMEKRGGKGVAYYVLCLCFVHFSLCLNSRERRPRKGLFLFASRRQEGKREGKLNSVSLPYSRFSRLMLLPPAPCPPPTLFIQCLGLASLCTLVQGQDNEVLYQNWPISAGPGLELAHYQCFLSAFRLPFVHCLLCKQRPALALSPNV